MKINLFPATDRLIIGFIEEGDITLEFNTDFDKTDEASNESCAKTTVFGQ